jgi:hypothetical protein
MKKAENRSAAAPQRTEAAETGTASSVTQGEDAERGEDAFGRLLQMRSKPDQPPIAAIQNDDPEFSLFAGAENGGHRGGWLSFGKHPRLIPLLSSIGAVAIGLVFGFFVLAVFTQEQFSKSYRSVLDDTLQTITAAGEQQMEQQQNGPPSDNRTGASAAVPPNDQAVFTDTTVTLRLPEQSFIMAQFGAFQEAAAAQTAVAQLEQQGYPHLLYEADDKRHLFVATAPTRDELLGLASSLKKKGMDIFVKEVKFPALEKTLNVKQDASAGNAGLTAFMETGVELAKTLAGSSSRVGNSAEAAGPSEAETAAWKEKHRRFLESSRSIQPGEAWQPLFNGMVTGLNQAVAAEEKMVQALAEKNQEKAEPYVWQVQAGVLSYLENYAKWLQIAQE